MADRVQVSSDEAGITEKAPYDWLVYYTPVRTYPPLADRKATAVLAAVGLMVSVVLMFSRPIGQIVLGGSLIASWIGWILVSACMALLMLASWFAVGALTVGLPEMPFSEANFSDIASVDREDYLRRVKALTYEGSYRAMLHYLHALSTQCARKFGLVGRAMAAIQGAFYVWLALLLWILTRS